MTVKKKRGRPGRAEKALSKEMIVDVAKGLLQTESKFPSIRKLAQELDVDGMAIYHYFDSKSLLQEATTISLVEEIYIPDRNGNWKTELQLLCKSYLKLLSKNVGLLETMLSMKNAEGPAGIFSQRLKIALQPHKLDDDTFLNILSLLADYLHGYAFSMKYNSDERKLGIDQIDSPLSYLLQAIERDIKS